MAAKRNLAKSLQFRYWAEDIAQALSILCLICAGTLFVALVAIGIAYLAGSTWAGMDTINKLFASLGIAFILWGLIPDIGDALCEFSHWRDDVAGRKGLAEWPLPKKTSMEENTKCQRQ